MSYEKIVAILEALKESLKIPYTYYQFTDPEEIAGQNRYIAYFESDKIRFLADDKVYRYEPQFAVELYTKIKDLEAEQALIALFDSSDVVWSGGETVYLDDEKMYQTVFYC